MIARRTWPLRSLLAAGVASISLGLAAPASALPDEPTPFWLGDRGPLVAPPAKKRKADKPAKKKPKRTRPEARVEEEPTEGDLPPTPAPTRKKKPKQRAAQGSGKARSEDEADAVLESLGVGRRKRRQASPSELPPLIAPAPSREPTRSERQAVAPDRRPTAPAAVERDLPPPPSSREPTPAPLRSEDPIRLPDAPRTAAAPATRQPARPADEDLLVPARPRVVLPEPAREERAEPVRRDPPPPSTALSAPPASTSTSPPASIAAPSVGGSPVATEARPPVVAPGARETSTAEANRADAAVDHPDLRMGRPRSFDVGVSAFAALWGSPTTVSGRQWSPTLGVRVATELSSAWALELYAASSGTTTTGNLYASTSSLRNLFGVHAGRWLYDYGSWLSVQAGLGVAVSLSTISYAFRDVGGDPTAVEGGSALKLAPEAGVTLRLRPVKLLELRVDLSGLYRDARVELLPSVAVGAWVAF